jgi:3',5'-cyclic AMP phosphodiesterase CpdA
MKLVLISDTHCQHGALKMPEGDVLVHAGDWTHRGEEHHTIAFLKWLDNQNYPHKVFIAGNHDFYPERNPAEFRNLVSTYAPNSIYLEDQSTVINGYNVHGSPVSPWFCDWAFNRDRGPDIQMHWDLIPDNTEILITHGPILGYGDKLSQQGSEPGKNIGCSDLLNTIDNRLKDLKLHISGHIHEGAGTYSHNGITVVNASVLDERYRMRNKPVVVTLPDKQIPDPKSK